MVGTEHYANMLVNSYLRDAHVPPPDEPLDVDTDAYSWRTLHPATNGEAVELSAQFGEVVPPRGVNSGPSRGSGKTRGRPAMVGVIRRLAIAGAAAFVPVAFVTVVCPGVSNAAECGFGTVFDPPTNTCVAAPLPPPLPPPPPPPPAWNGDLTPYFSVGICAPIPFVSLCTGI